MEYSTELNVQIEVDKKTLHQRIEKHKVNIAYIRKALSFCPEDFLYRPDIESERTEEYAQMGHCHYQLEEHTAAINTYSRARSTDPDHFQVLYQLGLCHLKIGLHEEAREFFHEIIERVRYKYDYTHRLDALLQIADTYIKEGKENGLEKASKYLLLVSEIAPNSPALAKIQRDLHQQQNIINLIKQARNDLEEQNWRRANTNIRALKQLAPHHPEVQQMDRTLRNTIANSASALDAYNGKFFGTSVPTKGKLDDDLKRIFTSKSVAG